ncbi:MAG: outer membrane lipoprotein-sorting protein [Candidatus Midichloriaceae bacterium]|jgi:outer membrane lipoprotein-sorting protein
MMLYFRKFFFIVLLNIYFIPNTLSNDKELVTTVENYLNSFTTLKAKFQQTASNANDIYKEGYIYISKPGKIRFEYLNPNKSFIVLNGKIVMYYDADLEETSYIKENNYFFQLLSREKLSIKDDVEKIEQKDGKIKLKILKKHNNITTNVTLIFSKDIMKLESIYFKNENQESYKVYFEDIEYDNKFDKKLFSVQTPEFHSSPY